MWRKAFILGLCAAVLLLCVAAGCSKQADEGLEHSGTEDAGFRKTVLYYRSDDGFVVPVMKLIPWEEGIGRAAVEQLIDTPENREGAALQGLNLVLNDGAEVTLRIHDDGVAALNIVNLGEYASALEERAMVEAVAATLMQFSSIESVQLLFDGKKLRELEWGTPVGEPIAQLRLNSEAEALPTGTDGVEYNAVTLYFPNQACSLNVPVTRYIKNIRTFETAVQELLAGPQLLGLRDCYPEGTQLLACSITQGVARVDLSGVRGVLETPGVYEALYESLCLTAGEYASVAQMEISVEGEALDPPEGVSIPQYANEFR